MRAGPEKLFPVVGGVAFSLEEVYPKDGFECPEGSRYATDDEAISLAQMSGSKIYTPYTSYRAVKSVPKSASYYKHARGKSAYRLPDGSMSSEMMYTAHNAGGYTNTYRAVAGTKDALQEPVLHGNTRSYYPYYSRPNEKGGIFRACGI